MRARTLSSLRLFAISLATLLTISGCGYNEIQGLDENVKAAAQFEQQTRQQVMEARAQATSVKLDANALSNPETFKKFEEAQRNLSGALSRLLVVVERYPELKANANFRDLQAQLEGTENRIAVARKRYVESVAEYNKGVRYFPTNLTAKYLLGLDMRQSFSAEDSASKPPAVKF